MTFKRAPGKYGNIKSEVDGIRFDSKLEARRYCVLKLLQQAGQISDLKLQVPYKLEINGSLVCKYVADFVYQENGQMVVEDSKGVETPEFKLKKKLMKAIHGIEIYLTRAK